MNRRSSNSKVDNQSSFPVANSSEKENVLTVAKIQPSRRVEQLLNDVRISACKTITNVKSSFEDMSQKLRGPMKKTRSFSKRQQYKGLCETVTPVKLYTPFTFVTPSPPQSNRKRVSPRRCSFKSPTNQFKKDVQDLNQQLQELEKVEKALCTRKMR
ncbi:hypothetical protein JTE90_011236 [Oedothorax gibbosus]|uniref:Uncharacterized protein n=1 Tax=Oedothorax gibbosus TaxID=931172 RepID=A0AAV6VZV4_9ARAC|nr:hypothetical protein JTE90_011236 [Oedothorax gibbosus]